MIYEPFYPSDSYDSMVASAGTIVKDWNIGDYQGDFVYLLKNEDKFGFVVVGYGSCSGCDALENCSNQEQVDQLKESIINDIFWGTAEEVKKYITNEDANRFYFYEDDWKDVRKELIEVLSNG